VENLDPELFCEEPARDERFRVVTRWAECNNLPDDHPDKEREFFHRQLNEEINGLENSARCLADFPDADWQLRMAIARQCSDEARHIEMFREMVEVRGGYLGQYPVMNFQYTIINKIDTLVGRLAVQNRSFEAEGIDAIDFGIEEARAKGQQDIVEFFEAQLADEITHVRYANEWIRIFVARNPRVLLDISRALTASAKAFRMIMGPEGMGVRYGVNEQMRLEAGFEPDEARAAVEHAKTARPARA
jgi:uncharacterized ferritin-like protein (DUF455 family)